MRTRDEEFAARGGSGAPELSALLRGVMEEAAAVIDTLPPERLAGRVTIQGYEVSVLEAIYSVVDHLALHAGQIMFATKLLTGTDLGFYRHLSSAAHGQRTP